MFNIEDLENYFEPIIEATENPFKLSSTNIYKEDGKIKTSQSVENIELNSLDCDLFDLIISEIEPDIIDVYPKNLLQKIYNRKKKSLIKIIEELYSDEFLLISENTKNKLKKMNIDINTEFKINQDDIILIGYRSRLIFHKSSDKYFINYDKEAWRVVKIN